MELNEILQQLVNYCIVNGPHSQPIELELKLPRVVLEQYSFQLTPITRSSGTANWGNVYQINFSNGVVKLISD